MADYLPPVVVRLKGDISDLLAKLETAKAAMDDLGKSGGKSFKDMKKDADAAFKDLDKDAKKAGEDSGNSFWQGWKNSIDQAKNKAQKDNAPGVPNWMPWVGAVLPIIPELTTALAGAIGAFGALGVAAGAGLGALGIALDASLKPILAAYQATGKTKLTDIKALSPAQLHSYDLLTQFMQRLQHVGDQKGLSVFNKGIADALPLLRYLTPLINTSAKAVDGLLTSFGKDIKTNSFKDFMSELTKMSGPAITGLGEAIGKIAVGIGNMVAAFGRSGVAMEAGRGLLEVLDKFDSWTGGQGMLNFLAKAKEDLPLVGRMLGSLGHLLTQLFDSLGGTIGRDEIQIITLLAGALSKLLAVPGFGPFLGNMLALTLMTSKMGSVGLVTGTLRHLGSTIAGLLVPGAVRQGFKDFGASLTMLGEKGGIRLAASELGALGGAIAGIAIPVGLIAGLGALIVWTNKYKNQGPSVVNALRAQSNAVGWNTKGYEQWNRSLQTFQSHEQKATQVLGTGTQATGRAAQAQHQFAQGMSTANNNIAKQHQFLTQLSTYLGISRRAALNLAEGARVSASAVDKGGQSYSNAMNKALAYANSLQHLNQTLSNLLQPQLNIIQAQIQFRQGNDSLRTALKASAGATSVMTSKGRESAQEMVNQAQNAMQYSQAIRKTTGSNQDAIGPLRSMLREMESLHAHGSAATRVMDGLRRAIAQLRSKTIDIHVAYNLTTSGLPPPGGAPVSGSGGHRILGYPNMAAGVAAPSAVHVHVHLDGKEITKGVKSSTFQYNIDNGNRSRGGNPKGTMAPK